MLARTVAIAVVMGWAPLAADAAFPPTVTILDDGLESPTAPAATLDGRAVVSRPLGDIDGDGLGDRAIHVPPTDATPCPGVALAPSSLGTGIDFTRETLDALPRIVDRSIADDRGGTDCAFRKLRGFTEPRRIGDLNGDGLIDFAINVTGIFDNVPRVVFGTTTPGARIDLDALDGSDGFAILNAPVIEPVGDLNGDGFADLAHGAGNSPFIGVIAGTTVFNALLDVDTIEPARRLVFPLPLASVTGLGDIDGDGFDDLLLYTRNDSVFTESRVPRIAYGAAGLSLAALDQPGARVDRLLEECGPRICSIVPIGDVDGDGLVDLFATQRFEQFNDPPRSILYGRRGGLAIRDAIADYPAGEATRLIGAPRFGVVVGRQYIGSFNDPYAIASGQRFDLDGDGVDDLLLGANDDYTLLFGLRGERPRYRSVSLIDGLLAARFDLSAQISPITTTAPAELGDLDFDGIDDFLWTLREPVNAVPGRSRDIGDEDVLGLAVRRAPDELSLAWRPVTGAARYDVSVGGIFVSEVAAPDTRLVTANLTDAGPVEILVIARDVNGTALRLQRRRLPAADDPGTFRADVYGPTLVELFWRDRCASVVLRDGVPLGRPRGASFLDETAEPARTHRYRLLCDVPIGADADGALSDGLRYQRASAAIEITTPPGPGGPPTDEPIDGPIDGPGTEPPVDPGIRPAPPSNLRVTRYSPKDAELFWDRADAPGQRYEIRRDGRSFGIQFGISYFDTALVPNAAARYDVVTIDADGRRSEPAAITLPGDAPLPGDEDGTTTPAPAGARLAVYSSTAAELLWTRAPSTARIVRTEIARDGAPLGNSPGNSFFDDTRVPGATYRYTLVAVAADGSRSAPVTVQPD